MKMKQRINKHKEYSAVITGTVRHETYTTLVVTQLYVQCYVRFTGRLKFFKNLSSAIISTYVKHRLRRYE